MYSSVSNRRWRGGGGSAHAGQVLIEGIVHVGQSSIKEGASRRGMHVGDFPIEKGC